MTVRRKPPHLAAQALGTIEPETKAVALPVHVSTTYIRDPDNQYRTGYIYGRPDNATVRQTEAVIAALEGAHEAMLFGSGMAAATSVVLALPPGSRVLAPQVCYWGFRDWLMNEAPLFGYKVDLVDFVDRRGGSRRDETRHEARVDRDAGQSALDHHRHRRRRRNRACGRRGTRGRLHRRDAGVHPAARARRRHRDAFGDEISQRPFRRDRRRARDSARGCALGAHQAGARASRRDPRAVRGVAAAARACARSTSAYAPQPKAQPCLRAASQTTRACRQCFIPA